MKYTASTSVQEVVFAPLQSIGFRNDGTVNVFVAPGPVPTVLPDVPSQGYTGTAPEQNAQWVRWNGYCIKPGEQISFSGTGTGAIPRLYSYVSASSTASLITIPEY